MTTCVSRRRLRRSSITKWGSLISQERFDLESPDFTGPSVPTYSTATPIMESSAASGRHISKFVKTAENVAAYDGFGSYFSGAAFCLPHQWWASCFGSVTDLDFTVKVHWVMVARVWPFDIKKSVHFTFEFLTNYEKSYWVTWGNSASAFFCEVSQKK